MENSERENKGDLERYAEETGKTQRDIEYLKQKRRLPCAYGAGDCVVSSYVINPEDGSHVEVMYCLIAKQITRPLFGSIEKRLKKAGCPEPNTDWLSNWKCKYADGGTYRI